MTPQLRLVHSNPRLDTPLTISRTYALALKLRQLVAANPDAAPIIERVLDHGLALFAGMKPKQTTPHGHAPLPWRERAAHAATVNPRPPTLPTGVITSLEEYYAACAVIGMLAALTDEPDTDSAVAWSCDFGEKMAREARRRGWGTRKAR